MLDTKPTPWTESVLEVIAPDQLMAHLTEVAPFIKQATDRSNGRWDVWEVLRCIAIGKMKLWLSRDQNGRVECCAVTQLIFYPLKVVCEIPFVGGDSMAHWLKFEDVIGTWAKAQGATELGGFDCRGGAWLRVLDGWERQHISIRKVL